MAKPKLFTRPPSLATSKTTYQTSSTRKQAPRGSRRGTYGSLPTPSSGILAFLATLTASSSTAQGYPLDSQPLPPDFLCPGLRPDLHAEPPLAPQASTRKRRERRDTSDYPSSSPHKRGSKRPFVPDKYTQGPDGRWRKTGNWSLYGYCNCETSPAEYATIPTAESDGQATSTPSSLPSDPPIDAVMEANLPPGWASRSSEDQILTYIILGLSLLLAILICIFMVGCLAWRKKRKSLTPKDIEKKASTSSLRLADDSEEESEETRQARKQQRLWAKASARWKANVRISARRRRVQRTMSSASSQAQASRTSLTSMVTSSSVEARMRSMVDVSDSASAHSVRENARDTQQQQISPSPIVEQSAPPLASPSSRPPSYLRNFLSDLSAHSDSIEHLHTSESVGESIAQLSTSHKTLGLQQRHDEDQPEDDSSPGPYDVPADAAHVATDDKGVLERMATLASAPPVSGNDNGESSAPSVPILEYEYEDHPDFGPPGPSSHSLSMSSLQASPPPILNQPAPSYSSNPDDPSTQHPLFPSPPSKSALAAPTFYEYPASFEEDMHMIMSAEPIAEPSAPPFEAEVAAPSAPPLEMDMEDSVGDFTALPSAPPMVDEIEDNGAGLPCASAPALQNEHESYSEDARPSDLSSSISATPPVAPMHTPPGYIP
ncbi:unnamed protein product [Somion occarium]|uniref:Uncharacterized protein n=1 Tax=Somion occarium TaxID=3059160 RepID=A0ABP1CHD1_9APHY